MNTLIRLNYIFELEENEFVQQLIKEYCICR